MKVMLFTALLFAGAAVSADPVVESVTQSTIPVADCPICPGGTMGTTTTFEISHVSCRGLSNSDFEVKVGSQPAGISNQQEKIVSIGTVEGLLDCAGPSRRRSYQVSTKELDPGQSYILLNPSRLKPQSLVQP